MSTLQMSIFLHSEKDVTETSWWVDETPEVINSVIKSFEGKTGYGAYIAATFSHEGDVDTIIKILTAMKQMLSSKPVINNSSTHWTNDN